jgi:hypothetical protein
MHTLSFVCDRLIGTVFSVVLGFVLGRWDPPETMHEPAGVVPVHPRRGGLLDVTDGAQRPLSRNGESSAMHSALYNPIVVSARALS